MGLIRSGIIITLSTLLFLSLFIGNAFLTLSWSLEYENVEPHLQNITNTLSEQQEISNHIQQNYQNMVIHCSNQEAYLDGFKNESLEIPCEKVTEGISQTKDYFTKEMVKKTYYKDNNCSLFECLKTQKNPFILVSKTAQDYWQAKYIMILVVSLILFLAMLVFLESKHSIFTITGILMILSALPFRKINWLLGFLPEGRLTELFSSLFTSSYNVFLIMTIIGFVLLALGIAFEFLGFGLKITKWIDKQKNKQIEEEQKKLTTQKIKQIVKEEMNNQQKPKKKK